MALYENYDVLLLYAGLALLATSIGASFLKRWYVSKVIVYLGVGIVAGPLFLKLTPGPVMDHVDLLERVSEFAVIVSLIVAGMKVGRPVGFSRWRSTVRLVLLVMPLSILAVAVTGHFMLGLALGPAILLGAVVAPTDPVVAGGVQLEDPDDDEEMRFGLTTEAGLNDGFAFPFVYLGLYATTKLDEWQAWLPYWAFKDFAYAIALALPLGWVIGRLGGRVFLRERARDAVSPVRRNLVPLALLLSAYGLVEILGAYGFLAAFTTGLGFRRVIEARATDDLGTFTDTTESVEQFAEAALIILLGSLLPWQDYLALGWPLVAFALVAILVLRPLVVWASTAAGGFSRAHRAYWSWFGIRGIGTIYYTSYALGQGIPGDVAPTLFAAATAVVVTSGILHGSTLAPLMERYDDRRVVM